MPESTQVQKSSVKTPADSFLVTIALNHPHVLNSLNLAMIRQIRASLKSAESNDDCKCVLICGSGGKAFCAGGDIKTLARWVSQGDFASAEQFFEEEYALDLYIHGFPKPLLVLADGIAMGGGLGLAAGADLVIATERTRMAMPETGIGFFPDVGATRWLFDKCPKGYAEFLGLTGHEMKGADTVRCGLATHLLLSETIAGFVKALIRLPDSIWQKKDGGLSVIRSLVKQHSQPPKPSQETMDSWVEKHFAEKTSLHETLASLIADAPRDPCCQETLKTLNDRSPTALMLTFMLLRTNAKQPLKDVFQAEQKAAAFMIRHSDYLEGVRARVLEKDHRPQWNPGTIEGVSIFPDFFH